MYEVGWPCFREFLGKTMSPLLFCLLLSLTAATFTYSQTLYIFGDQFSTDDGTLFEAYLYSRVQNKSFDMVLNDTFLVCDRDGVIYQYDAVQPNKRQKRSIKLAGIM